MTTPSAAPAPPLALRRLPAEARAEAAATWQALEAAAGEVPVSASWLWTETWLRHYGDLVPHAFVVGERGGEPRAVALVTEGVGRRRGPLRLRTLHLGTAGEPQADSVDVNYNHVLAVPEDARAFAAALLDHLESRSGWDEIRLEGLAPAEAELFLAARPGARIAEEACRVADLDRLRHEHGAVLPAVAGRRQIRRSIRRLGGVEGEWAEDVEQALDIYDELVRLHQRRWLARGQPGVFASDRFRRFHRELIERGIGRGRVALFRVRAAGGETVGCSYALIEGRRILSYQGGRGEFHRSRISAGSTTEVLFMEEALRRGFGEHDMLAGDSEWKRLITTDRRRLVWVTLRPGGLRGATWSAVDAAAALRRRIRERRAER